MAGPNELPKFAYFPDPVGAGVFEKSKQKCECCDRARGWIYTGPVYLAGDEPTLCPWCIADGAAALQFGCSFNDTGQLYASSEDQQEPPDVELEVVESRTPGYETWQGNAWYVCCGHPAQFLGPASGADLKGRWRDAFDVIFAGADEIVEAMGDEWQELEVGDSPGMYVFKCTHCNKLGGYFDMD